MGITKYFYFIGNLCQRDQASPPVLHIYTLAKPVQVNCNSSANCLIGSTTLLNSKTTLLWQQIESDYTNKNLKLHKIQRGQIMLCHSSYLFHHHLPNSPSPPLSYISPSLSSGSLSLPHFYSSSIPQLILPSYQPAFPCCSFLLLYDDKKDQQRSQYVKVTFTVWH